MVACSENFYGPVSLIASLGATTMLADFDHALQLGGRNDWARYGRALARQQLGQGVLARADFAGARMHTPDIENQVTNAGLAPAPGARP